MSNNFLFTPLFLVQDKAQREKAMKDSSKHSGQGGQAGDQAVVPPLFSHRDSISQLMNIERYTVYKGRVVG